MRAYTVSLLKAWWGDGRDGRERLLLRLPAPAHRQPQHLRDGDGAARRGLQGLLPARARTRRSARPTARCSGSGMANLDWLVVRDFSLIESATFWKDGPEIESGELRTEDIGTEVFFLPAAAHTEKAGSFTNTQRMLQWHHTGGRAGRGRPQRPVVHLPPGPHHPGEAGRLDRRDGPAACSTSPGTTRRRAARRADCRGGAGRDQRLGRRRRAAVGVHRAARRRRRPRAAAGSTAGCTPTGVNQAARRKPGQRAELARRPSGAGRGRPTGASCTTGPPPIPTASRGASARPCVWWDAGAGHVDRARRPRLRRPTRRRTTSRPTARPAPDALSRAPTRSSCRPTARRWLYAPAGLVDGPLPAHYEPQDSPVRNPLYAPAAQPGPAGDARSGTRSTGCSRAATRRAREVFPYVATTYRLTEHHTAGGMSRWLPYLSELQPEFFCEVSPELAAERGLDAPRLGDDRHRAGRDRGPGAGHRADARRWPWRASELHQVGPALPLGLRRACQHRRRGQRPGGAQPGPQRPHPGESRRSPVTSGPDGGRAGRRGWHWSREYQRRAGITEQTGTER